MSWRDMRALLDLRHSLLSNTDRSVLFALRVRAGDKGVCWPRQTKIADDTGLSERTVRDCTNKLERLGLIKVTRRDQNRRSCIYEFTAFTSAQSPRDPLSEANIAGKSHGNTGASIRQKPAPVADRMNNENEKEGDSARASPFGTPVIGVEAERACQPQQMRELINKLAKEGK